MSLTTKQEAFAQEVAKGRTQADAYRAAYSARKMADATIWSKASELMANGKVAARVTELKAELSKKALWTREMSVKALIKVYAHDETPAGVRVAAVRELNQMHGFDGPEEAVDEVLPVTVIIGRKSAKVARADADAE